MRLVDADELIKAIKSESEKGFPANENMTTYAISCITHAPTVDAIPLDKIKSEIKQKSYGIANDDVIQGMKYERADILEIIDKYKAESEG